MIGVDFYVAVAIWFIGFPGEADANLISSNQVMMERFADEQTCTEYADELASGLIVMELEKNAEVLWAEVLCVPVDVDSQMIGELGL